jgi:hypothetical protein
MLTAVEVRNAKPRGKPYKLFDGAGLYLEVTPNGARYWRLKYRFGGKEKRLALGVYPRVSIAEARERRDCAHRLLRDGGDPSAVKQAAKREAKLSEGNAFRIVAEEWISKQRSRWDPKHAEAVAHSLELNIFPELGHRLIEGIEAPELRAVLQKFEKRGAHEVRQRVQQRVGAVFRHGIATGRCLRNPAPELRTAFRSEHGVGIAIRPISGLNHRDLLTHCVRFASASHPTNGNTRYRPARYGFDRAGLAATGLHQEVSVTHLSSSSSALIPARSLTGQQRTVRVAFQFARCQPFA